VISRADRGEPIPAHAATAPLPFRSSSGRRQALGRTPRTSRRVLSRGWAMCDWRPRQAIYRGRSRCRRDQGLCASAPAKCLIARCGIWDKPLVPPRCRDGPLSALGGACFGERAPDPLHCVHRNAESLGDRSHSTRLRVRTIRFSDTRQLGRFWRQNRLSAYCLLGGFGFDLGLNEDG
jgi:hypothetical protein